MQKTINSKWAILSPANKSLRRSTRTSKLSQESVVSRPVCSSRTEWSSSWGISKIWEATLLGSIKMFTFQLKTEISSSSIRKITTICQMVCLLPTIRNSKTLIKLTTRWCKLSRWAVSKTSFQEVAMPASSQTVLLALRQEEGKISKLCHSAAHNLWIELQISWIISHLVC